MHAVPVHGGRLVDVVGHGELDPVTLGGPDGGAEVGAVDAPGRGLLAVTELRLAGLDAQVEVLHAVRVNCGFQ